MKLFFSSGACSLAPHIALREAGIMFEAVKAALKTHTLADGSDYYAINPKGQVPALELDGGERLTECAVILQYIADHAPASGLAPVAGTMPRYRLMEWLNFISSEVHKGFSPLFNPALAPEAKQVFSARLKERLAWIDSQLADRDYLMGDRFCVADAYLFTVSGWANTVGPDISDLKNLAAYRARVAARPAVREAMQAEGLLK